jgi:hypothetical protein
MSTYELAAIKMSLPSFTDWHFYSIFGQSIAASLTWCTLRSRLRKTGKITGKNDYLKCGYSVDIIA